VTGVILVLVGLAVAAVGTMVAAGAGGVSRLTLARWVSQRQHGAALATALLSAPAKVVGPAMGLTAAGIVLVGLGLSPMIAPFRVGGTAAAILASSAARRVPCIAPKS